jgi:hypothetical protein
MKLLASMCAAVLAITTFVLAARFARARQRGVMPIGEYAAGTFVIFGCILGAMTCIAFGVWNGPLDQLPRVVPILAVAAVVMFAAAVGIRGITRLRQRKF